MFKKFIFLIAFCIILVNSARCEETIPNNINLDNLLLMELEDGVIIIEMNPEAAPWTVYRIKLLTSNGFYNNQTFYRGIKNFIVQTGDPTGTGKGGSQFGKMYAEIKNSLYHVKGTVSMARADDDINSANSQFFIVLADSSPHLDGKYTIWGKVIYGMDLIEKISTDSDEQTGLVKNPTRIVKMKLAQDFNFNYQDDTEQQIEERRKQRIAMLQSLKELKILNDQLNIEQKENVCLLDRLEDFNKELD